jgi:adenylylsulfate kinase-like enzyme
MKAPEPTTPSLFVISGNQGAGKSTVGELLAKRFVLAAHIDGDRLEQFVVSGRRWPESLDDLDPASGLVFGEAGRQLRLRLQNGCLVACSFVDAGITAVLTDIICGPRYDEMRHLLGGRTIYFVMLHPPIEVLRLRLSHRHTGGNDFESHLEAAIDSTPRVGLWLESASLSVDATVDEILSRRAEARIQLPA